MGNWTIDWHGKKIPAFRDAILIEGLPGIGNVGKIVADFLSIEMGSKPLADFFSPSLPHSVFVTEDNLVKLPTIEAVVVKSKKIKRDIILLLGDVQPADEESSYGLADAVLELCAKCNVTEIVTLGGIGLPIAPKKPSVYCTGNNSDYIKKFIKGTDVKDELYGVVGPIIGITGLLLSLASRKNIKSIALLGETAGHPMFLGIKASGEILKVLKKRLGLPIKLEQMEKEIKEVEQELMKRTDELHKVSQSTALKKLKGKFTTDVDYIG